MISPNNQTYILKLVERLLPTILEEVDFDPTVKAVSYTHLTLPTIYSV